VDAIFMSALEMNCSCQCQVEAAFHLQRKTGSIATRGRHVSGDSQHRTLCKIAFNEKHAKKNEDEANKAQIFQQEFSNKKKNIEANCHEVQFS